MLKFILVNKWGGFQMNDSPKGPYQYYERPNKNRTDGEKPTRGNYWGVVISILLIILVILLPVVYHMASEHYNKAEKPKEVQRVKSSSSAKKVNKAKSSKQSKKTSQSAADKSNSAKNSAKTLSQSSSTNKAKTYVVQDGDTLTGIAQREGVSIASLVKINNLNGPEDIQAGQTIRLR